MDGVFNVSASDPLLHRLDLDDSGQESFSRGQEFGDWAAAVRERARLRGS